MSNLNPDQFKQVDDSAYCGNGQHAVTRGQLCGRNENAPIQDHGENYIHSRDHRYEGNCVKHCGHGPMAHA